MAKTKKLRITQKMRKEIFAKSQALQNLAYGAAKQKSDRLRRDLLREFDNHPVTKEIEQGPSGTSSLLGGRGNFFGFLGFNSGDKPIEILRDSLNDQFKILSKKGKVKKASKTSLIYSFDILYPTKTQIYAITPLAWTSKSWVKGVEKGITNYTQTVFKKSENSRSGVALQTDRKIGFIRFSPTPYVTQMLDKIRKELK
jgi:hypothetical protein|tara:strand:- start:240 stop:836 length:597 start_codon:yes stop_codon:yes gene_type:complete